MSSETPVDPEKTKRDNSEQPTGYGSYRVGDLCIHKGFLCRVDKIERVFSKGQYGVPDGTEYNPNLTLTALFTPAGEPVKKAIVRKVCSGGTERADKVLREMEAKLSLLQRNMASLKA